MPPSNRRSQSLSQSNRKDSHKIKHRKVSGHSRKEEIITNQAYIDQVGLFYPSNETAFKALLSARFCAAVWSHITDCDETYNYWEPRTSTQLQKCWDSLKCRRKRALAVEKQMIMGTGGGPFKKPKPNEDDDDDVDAILTAVTETELSDPLDSDSIFINSKQPKVDVVDIESIDIIFEDEVTEEEAVDSDRTMSGIEEAVPVQPEPPRFVRPPQPINPVTVQKRAKLPTARQAAVNIELEERLRKLTYLQEAEKSINDLRIEQERLKVECEQLKIEEQKLKNEQEKAKLEDQKLKNEQEKVKLEMYKEELRRLKIQTNTDLIIKFREENQSH